MPQTPSFHSSHSFQPVSPVVIEPSMEEVSRPTRIQMDTFPGPSNSSNSEEPLSEYKLLGPFRNLIKITGLDCSLIALAQTDPSLVRRALITRIFAIFIIVVIFFRCGMIFKATGAPISFQWAESNMFAFMGIHTIVCAFCLFGWTKNAFIPKHLERLEVVRKLRLTKNPSLDDYSALHKRAWIWACLWFLCIMAHSIASAISKKVITGGEEANMALTIFMPIATFLTCFVVTLCVIIYFLVNCQMTRELEQFNKDLEEAVKEKRLGDVEESMKFAHRQAELIRVVRIANDSLGSYASSAPIFCFYGFVNAIYVVSFENELSTPIFAILLFNLFAIIAMTVFTLRPASNVQLQITDTSRILMDCEEFQKSKSSELFQNYHIMIDRSLKTNTRIRVAGGIPIYQTTMNVSMFLIPNLGNILALIRKVLLINGVKV